MKFDPSKLTIIRDTREQDGFTFPNFRVEDYGLSVGDYSVKFLTEHIRIERKSLPDLISSLTQGRDRFQREMTLIRAFKFRCIVVEGGLVEVIAGSYRSKATPNSILASCASWSAKYAPIHFCGDRSSAERYCQEFLIQSARAIWTDLAGLQQAVAGDVKR